MKINNQNGGGKETIKWIVGGALAAVVVFVLALFLLKLTSGNNSDKSAKSSETTSRAATVKKSSRKSNSKKAVSKSVETTNFAKFSELDGEYRIGNDEQIAFARGVFVERDAYGAPHDLKMTKVIKNPDGTILVDANGSYDIRGGDGRQRLQERFIRLLIVPKGVSLTKDWITGEALTDATSPSSVRVGEAESNDRGKTYDMSYVHQAFAENSDRVGGLTEQSR